MKDQSDTTNSTLTDISARLERIERAGPDLNLVELRTNPSDGNFAFHAVPPRPSHLQKPGGPKVVRAALRRRAIDGQFAVM